MTTHVLIVEDDPLIAMDLEAIAEEEGHSTTWCATLREALGEVDRRDYALALLDVDVPDGKTFAVARRLMDRAVPFAFVSAIRRVDIPLEFADARIVGKPYRPNEVRSALRTAS
jgi:DNA-binding response OmpR family regulator